MDDPDRFSDEAPYDGDEQADFEETSAEGDAEPAERDAALPEDNDLLIHVPSEQAGEAGT